MTEGPFADDLPLPPFLRRQKNEPERSTLAATVETAVRDCFEKCFTGKLMPYAEARALVWLERQIVEEVVFRLCGKRG